MLSSKPEDIKSNDYVDQLYKKVADYEGEREIIRSIQISDLHIDFKYEVGQPTQCNFAICCRDNGPSQVALENSTPA